jgi:hypothetical protein
MASTFSQNPSHGLAVVSDTARAPHPRARMALLPLLRRGRWYASRLAAMPSREIPHRIAEAHRRRTWRRDFSGWESFEAVGDGALAELTPLRARLARAGMGADHPVTISHRRTLEGQFSFLGLAWPAIAADQRQPLQIPGWFWFHDPVTGNSWPDARTPSFDVDVRSTGIRIGDVKYVFEPNR